MIGKYEVAADELACAHETVDCLLMQDDPDLDLLTKAFEIEYASNRFVESSLRLHHVIVANCIIRVDGCADHTIRVPDFSESSRKCLITKPPTIGEETYRRIRQLQFHLPHKRNQRVSVQCRLAARKPDASGIGRNESYEFKSPSKKVRIVGFFWRLRAHQAIVIALFRQQNRIVVRFLAEKGMQKISLGIDEDDVAVFQVIKVTRQAIRIVARHQSRAGCLASTHQLDGVSYRVNRALS